MDAFLLHSRALAGALLFAFSTLLLFPELSCAQQNGITRHYKFDVCIIPCRNDWAYCFQTCMLICSIHSDHFYPRIRGFLQIQMTNVTRLCHTKSMVTVNGQYPGPRIVAREGDRVIVKVVNHVQSNVSIHWYVRNSQNIVADWVCSYMEFPKAPT